MSKGRLTVVDPRREGSSRWAPTTHVPTPPAPQQTRRLPATRDPTPPTPLPLPPQRTSPLPTRPLPTTHDPASYTLPLPPPPPPKKKQQQPMAKDYRQLWKEITAAGDEGKTLQTLAKILLDKESRTFISNLAPKNAELCIETLDHVSRDPYLLSALTVSNGFFRVSLGTTSKLPRNMISLSR